MACFAPSILGWMLSWPGVAIKSATSPSSTRLTIRLPISTPERKRSWPTYASAGLVPVPFAVGVVSDHRDTIVQGLLDRLVEGYGIHDTDGYAVGVARDGSIHRVDHLRDDRFLRARPLRRSPKESLCVLDAVLRRHEERVRGDVVDEDEVPFWRVREVAARPASTALARLLRSLTPASCEQ